MNIQKKHVASILISIVFALALTLIIIYTKNTRSNCYEYNSTDGAPTIEEIVDTAGQDLRPQMIALTLPQISWYLLLEKIGIPAPEARIPRWVNLDLRFIFDIFLKVKNYTPPGGLLLYKYNFTKLDNEFELSKYIGDLDQYSTELKFRNKRTNEIFSVKIKPFKFSDCVPNNIPKHYCRIYSKDEFNQIFPQPKTVEAAIEQYKEVTKAYKKIGLTSPLGPAVDMASDSPWSTEETAKFAKATAQYMFTQGVIPTLKHFGYNHNTGDAHLDAYHDIRSLSSIEQNDFQPYREVNSLQKPFFIMTTHFYMNSLDNENVATRSTRVVNYIRRNFEHAIVIADEISMGGFSSEESFSQRVLAAQGDIFLIHSGLGADIWSRRNDIYHGIFQKNTKTTRESILNILKAKAHYNLLEITKVSNINH